MDSDKTFIISLVISFYSIIAVGILLIVFDFGPEFDPKLKIRPSTMSQNDEVFHQHLRNSKMAILLYTT